MRLILAVLALASFSSGQWIEATLPLPDTFPWLDRVGAMVFHAPNDVVYVGGTTGLLVALDARTITKLTTVDVGPGGHVLCSDPLGNKVYCANGDTTLTVVDGATNKPVKTFSVGQRATSLAYNGLEDKIYCGNRSDSFVRVIDCTADSVLARVPVSLGPGALCYNPRLNRIYCAHEDRDEVTVIDCAADTVVAKVWVRGVEPRDICYDSVSSCVYTANATSNTVSVIDCAGDTLVRVLLVGSEPTAVIAGPPGKVWCANRSDSSVSVLSGGGVKTVPTGRGPRALSYDPASSKVYCANSYADSVTVLDATADTVLVQVRTGPEPSTLCYNPADKSTFVAYDGSGISVIGGESDLVENGLAFGPVHPDLLCYNTVTDRLYCSDGWRFVLVIDGNTNTTRRAFPVFGEMSSMVWNPYRNKAYVTAAYGGKGVVHVIDGATDHILASVAIVGLDWMTNICYNRANDKVYVAPAYDSMVSVIDGAGDSIVATVRMDGSGGALAYNSVSNKVYCFDGIHDVVAVVDGAADTVVARIAMPDYAGRMCYVPRHNKLYVGSASGICVVDGSVDSLVTVVQPPVVGCMSYDIATDRLYVALAEDTMVNVYDPSADTLVSSISVGAGLSFAVDNGLSGDANRVYCAAGLDDSVWVISGTADTIIRGTRVGDEPTALAWNPARSWMYVANSEGASITVLRDTLLVGVEENWPQTRSRRPQATVVRDVLWLGPASGTGRGAMGELLDVSGRKVMDLTPGANDVGGLALGVYFVRRPKTDDGRPDAAIQKVVVTR